MRMHRALRLAVMLLLCPRPAPVQAEAPASPNLPERAVGSDPAHRADPAPGSGQDNLALYVSVRSPHDCPITMTGDVNLDGVVRSSDIVYMVVHLFKGGAAPGPIPESGDVNCDGSLTASDIIYLVAYVFRSAAPPCDVCSILPDLPGGFYSFETGMESWSIDRTDIDLGTDTIAWGIERCSDTAFHGVVSLRLQLENYNDAGKIWIERPFIATASSAYRVEVDFRFASRDWGVANHFRIIAGVSTTDPETREDLVYQDGTGNGSDTGDVGYVWLDKSYSFDVTSDSTGYCWIAIGVWGVWEAPRTYYVDHLNVRFAPR